jgi:hypothetical protein
VKAEVKFVFPPSPAAVRKRSSQDEEKPSDLIPDRRGMAIVYIQEYV